MDHKEVSKVVEALAEAGREMNSACERIESRERTRKAVEKGGRIVADVLTVPGDACNTTHLLNRLDSISALAAKLRREMEGR